MARPTSLTEEMHAAIVARIEGGLTGELAAECEGLDRRTYYRWMERGAADPESRFGRFLHDVTQARAKARAVVLDEIRQAVTAGQTPMPDWRARAWYLERTSRDDFGAQVEIRVERELERFIERLRTALDPATFDRVLTVLVGARDAPSPGESGGAGGGDGGVGGSDAEPDADHRH